jgi:hypothetical protein
VHVDRIDADRAGFDQHLSVARLRPVGLGDLEHAGPAEGALGDDTHEEISWGG